MTFFRGFWCSYCVEQLAALERMKSDDLKNVPILAVTPDPPSRIRDGIAAVQKSKGILLTHRFLSDISVVYAARYGLGQRRSDAAPLPTLVLLDRNGREAFRFSESHYAIKPVEKPLRAALLALRNSPAK